MNIIRPGTKTNTSMHCFTAKTFALVFRTKVQKNQNKLASNHTYFDRKILVLKNWVFFWKIWSTGPKDTWRGMECISLKDASATSWSMIVQKKKKRSDHWSRKEKLLCSGTQQIHFFAPGDSNFPRGKFYASTDWLSLYPPLSRFKPLQTFLIGRLSYIESVQSVLDIFTAAK